MSKAEAGRRCLRAGFGLGLAGAAALIVGAEEGELATSLRAGMTGVALGAELAETATASPADRNNARAAADRSAAAEPRRSALLAALLDRHEPQPGPALPGQMQTAQESRPAGVSADSPEPPLERLSASEPGERPQGATGSGLEATTYAPSSNGIAAAAARDPAADGRSGDAIEPAAGITYRRDPLDRPLLETERWSEWVLSVTLNGRELDESVVFIEDPVSGRIAVELATAERWRLRIDPDRILGFEGVPFYPLDAVDAVTSAIDEANLAIRLDIPPDAFEMHQLDIDRRETPAPTPGSGGFFDYDLLVTGGEGVSDRLDGLFEAGAFAEGHVLISNFRAEDLGDDAELQRLETTLSRDIPEWRASLRVGDSLTNGGAFAQGVRFAGLQWATNFATDPSFVTFPLPTIGGLAEQESVVDVIVDNLTRATESVPPGPFAITNVPVVTGGGEVQLRVTDLLGRERLVTQPYYVSTRLLKSGLSDFSYAVGVKREDFGEKSFSYGDVLASATHRYGFDNAFTGELHVEGEEDRGSVVGGGALLLGPYGLLSGGIGGSTEESAGEGVLGEIAYEYLGQRLSFGARTRYTSRDFRQAAGDDGRIERVDQINLGFDARRYGRFGLLLLNQARHDADNQRSLTGSFSLPVGPGSLVVNAAQTLEPERDLAITAAYSLPLGPQRSLSAIGRASDRANRARLQYTRTRGASELGLDYRIAGEVGENARPIDARLAYQTRLLGTTAEVERFSGDNRFRLGVNGSAALVDGTFGLTRRIGRAFGLVDLPGFPNVRVYLDNREAGVTDAAGRLILPNLRPYEPNRVRLAVEDLPLSAELVTGQAEAVPYDRSGMSVDFGIVAVQRATVVLRDGEDQPLPAGLVLTSDTEEIEAMVGRDGYTQLTGRLDQPIYLSGEARGERYVCAVPAAPQDDPLPHLGDVRCAD